MTLVKICGITSVDDAIDAYRAGADQLGFVLSPGRTRSIEPDVVVAVREAIRQYALVAVKEKIVDAIESGDHRGMPAEPEMPELIGVVVDERADHVRALVEQSGVDVVQLSGLPERALATLEGGGIPAGVRVMRVIHVGPDASEQPRRAASDWERRGAFVTFDTHVPGEAGGTGVPIDQDELAALCAVTPRGVAGGLTPATVGDVIRQARPALVDVSSGVELAGVPGRKDPAAMRAFVGAVRQLEVAT